MIKSIKSSDHIVGYTNSKLASNENNDCFVRALASAFGLSYDVAHEYVKENFNRPDRKGTYGCVPFLNTYKYLFNKKLIPIPSDNLLYEGSKSFQKKYRFFTYPPKSPITLKIFLERYPQGTYILVTHNHAITIIDGYVIGNEDDGNKLSVKIISAAKIES